MKSGINFTVVISVHRSTLTYKDIKYRLFQSNNTAIDKIVHNCAYNLRRNSFPQKYFGSTSNLPGGMYADEMNLEFLKSS